MNERCVCCVVKNNNPISRSIEQRKTANDNKDSTGPADLFKRRKRDESDSMKDYIL